MIVATLRTLMIALMSLLLAGQQLACACASHHSAPDAASAHQAHAAHAHQAAGGHHEHAPPLGEERAPAADCTHCDHPALTSAAGADTEAAPGAQPPALSPPLLATSELAWRLPAKSRERPPPPADPPPAPLSSRTTRLLI